MPHVSCHRGYVVDASADDRGQTERAGLYGPDSEAWRLNREAMLLLGAGPRALLMQIAHPAVAAGVDDHSDFRADPWRRLQGTLRSLLTIVYGSAPEARAEIRRLNALHRAITGRGYAARDPELSLWVHATLVDATIVANDAWLGPVSPERRAAFYAETRPVGRAFGVPEAMLPADLAAFEGYLERMLGPDGPVRVGPLARELAEVIVHPPLPGGLGEPAHPGRALRLDDVAVDRAAPGVGPRGVWIPLGSPRAHGLGLARGGLASLAALAPGVVPADAAGARGGRTPRRRRALSPQ